VYFLEKGLNLTDSEDYNAGMEDFWEETLNNIDYYLEQQRQKGLYIKLSLHLHQNIVTIEVRNNSTITPTELSRIRHRLTNARKYNDLEDAIVHVLDDSEGAGLGLVILVQMMKKIGLNEDNFDILRTDNETIARIVIPRDLKKSR
jgi:hypothetical protein